MKRIVLILALLVYYAVSAPTSEQTHHNDSDSDHLEKDITNEENSSPIGDDSLTEVQNEEEAQSSEVQLKGDHQMEKRSESTSHHNPHPKHVKRGKRSSAEEQEEPEFEMHGIHARSVGGENYHNHHITKRSFEQGTDEDGDGHGGRGEEEDQEHHSLNKRNAETTKEIVSKDEELEPTFASDHDAQVHSVALRVKRVNKAGSSHRPRILNKNHGNSRVGQTDEQRSDSDQPTVI